MSGTDAAATLTLRISTEQAAQDLTNLENRYKALRAALGAPTNNKGLAGVGKDAAESAKKIETLTAQIAAMQAKTAVASDGMANNMKIMLRSAEMTGAAAIKAGEAQLKAIADVNRANTSAAQAANNAAQVRILKERAEAATIAAAAEARLAQVSAASISTAQASSNAAQARILRERAEAATLAAAAEARLAQASAASISTAQASSNAAQARILRERAEAANLAAEAELRLAAATRTNTSAAQAAYAANQQRLVQERAGKPAQAYNALMNTTSVATPAAMPKELEASHKSLSNATKESAASQIHWNKVANEGHAAARGLAGGLGALWLTYGSLAPLLAGAVIAGSMRQILSVGKDLEFQFTMVSAISNGATVDIEKFNKAVAGTMFTPTEAAQGLRVLAQAGLEVDQALTALPSVLKLATVGETDMATAALSATSIMHAFGLSVNDMSHIGDVFAKAAAISATSVTAMMEAMKQASSVSDIFGVSMEETAASLATLANRGIEGSAAGTALRNMVKELAAPATDKAAAAMKQYGIEVFRADGSTKTLTENLQQLSEATSTMTDKSRTKFLEVLFNERGVKAANILLTDMQKMKVALDEIRMSSEGLGFMTEAQIKLSQSTEGMLKTLRSGFENTLADVFKEVAPQIKEIISALSDIAGSSEFKAFLTSTAQTVAYLTKTFLENIETVKLLGATYLAFKGISFAASAFNVLSVAVKEVTVGMRVLAAVDMTATAASMSAAAASGVQTTAALSAVAATGTKTGTVVANLAAGFTSLLSPINLVIAGIGLTVVAGYNLYKMLTDVTAEQAKATEAAHQYAQANQALAQSVDAGARAIANEIGVLDEQIKLLRQGKTAADAYAQAKANAPVREAEANLAAVEAKLKTATYRVTAGPIGGGDATAESNEQRQNIRALEAIAREYQDVYKTTAEIRKQTGKALEDSKELASKRATVDNVTSNRNLNDRLAEIKKSGDAAAEALKVQTYANGVSKEAADRARERLQKQVDLRDKTSGIRSRPLSDDASQAERESRKAQLDSLLDNTFEPKGRTKPGGGGRSFNDETKDIVRGYGLREQAQNQEFENYKKILDQRVKYGALSQEAENVLLEAAREAIDGKTTALAASEKGQLQALLVSKETDESAKESIRRRIEEIDSVNALTASKREHTVIMREELAELKNAAAERKLAADTQEFVEKEERSRQRAQASFEMAKTHTAEARAAMDAYLTTIDRGEAKLKEYEKAVRDAREALSQMREEFEKLGPLNETQVAALDAQSQAAERASSNYDRLKESIEGQAEANAQSTLAMKAQEEGLNRLQSGIQASNAMMSAMLDARTTSGYYTSLESMRAEGNINKERIAQLAQLKASYEAMGEAGVAAAAQVEAEMISLSAHLDPIADKVREIFEGAFTNFFDDMLNVINGTKSLKAALKDLGNTILKDLWGMASKELSQQFMKILGGGLEPGKGAGLFSLISQAFVPDSRKIGNDIVEAGRSLFNRVSGGGASISGSFKSAATRFNVLGGAPSDVAASAPNVVKGLKESVDSAVISLNSLGTASTTSQAAFSTLNGSIVTSQASITALGTSSAVSEASISAMGATSALTEASMIGTEASSLLADVALASTAVSATAASAGLSSVAATSSTDAVGGLLGNVFDISTKGLFEIGGLGFHKGGVVGLESTFLRNVPSSVFQNAPRFHGGGLAGDEVPAILQRGEGVFTAKQMEAMGLQAQAEGFGGSKVVNITVNINGNNNNPQDVRRAAGQGAREAMALLNSARRYA